MKRPDGWDELRIAKYGDPCSDFMAGYEAGADALSELLKAQGISYENGMSRPSLAGFIYSRVAGKKGHIVFIEGEE